MDKLEALIACRNHWQWLWITGDENKRTYKKSRRWLNGCACCDYSYDEAQDDVDCSKCPLNGYAWSSEIDFGCEDAGDSFYYLWKTEDEPQDWAKKMVDACNKSIEALILGES